MSREYDYLIYIGRFQPLHLGHQSVIDTALEKANKVIILIGSANRPRSNENPWTFEERESMIAHAYPFEASPEINRLSIRPLDDVDYNDLEWLANVQRLVSDIPRDAKVGVIGFDKDGSSYYLKKFPQWELFLISEQWGTVSATQIRENFFQKAPIIPHDLCSDGVVDFHKKFMLTKDFKYVLNEFLGLADHHAQWPKLPYPLQTVTVDSVVTQSGHILLVERNQVPGVGLLALPGGHVEVRKGDSFDNAVAELIEEANPRDAKAVAAGKKSMPASIIRNTFTGAERRFDKPGRDPRGYYLTTAFRFVFPDGPLWSVAGDEVEVKSAKWYPIGDLDPKLMFADHYFIIQQMLDETKGR